jgi:hypothetical protein
VLHVSGSRRLLEALAGPLRSGPTTHGNPIVQLIVSRLFLSIR